MTAPTELRALDLAPRLTKSAERVKDIRAELDAELERRNDLIRQALDEGMSFRAVGSAAGMTPGGVAGVAATPARS